MTKKRKVAVDKDDLDRELILQCASDESGKPYGWAAYKIKLGKNTIRITNGADDDFTFKKRHFIGDGLELICTYKPRETKQCDLGHFHVIKKEEKKYIHSTLSWQHVEQLIEWLNHGSWSQLNRKIPRHVNLFQRTIKLLSGLDNETNALFKSEIRYLIREMQEEIRPYKTFKQKVK